MTLEVTLDQESYLKTPIDNLLKSDMSRMLFRSFDEIYQRIEDLENQLRSQKTSLDSSRFVDLTELAKDIVASTVKIDVLYDKITFYESLDVDVPFKGYGSGCVVSPDGYILTNFHVVNGSQSVQVFNNHTQEHYDAEICCLDPAMDLALIKIPEADLPYFTFGDSRFVQVGDFVLLMGNPLGLKNLLTVGVVGALANGIFDTYDVEIESDHVGKFADYIISDTNANPGNSGGPLVNLKGELIGVLSRGGEGLSLAVASNTAASLLDQFEQRGFVERNSFGASLMNLDESEADYFGLLEYCNSGVIVVDVALNSSAHKGGLQKGDFILTYNQKSLLDVDQFYYDLIRCIPTNDTVLLEIVRKGQVMTLDIPLLSSRVYDVVDIASLGVKVQPLKDEDYFDLGIENDVQGLKVDEVKAFSPAYMAQITPGDVISAVIDSSFNEIKVKDVREFEEILSQYEEEKMVLLKVISPNSNRPFIISVSLS